MSTDLPGLVREIAEEREISITPDGIRAVVYAATPINNNLLAHPNVEDIFRYVQTLHHHLGFILTSAIENHPENSGYYVIRELIVNLLLLSNQFSEEQGRDQVTSYDILYTLNNVYQFKDVLTGINFPFALVPVPQGQYNPGLLMGLRNYLDQYQKNLTQMGNQQIAGIEQSHGLSPTGNPQQLISFVEQRVLQAMTRESTFLDLVNYLSQGRV